MRMFFMFPVFHMEDRRTGEEPPWLLSPFGPNGVAIS